MEWPETEDELLSWPTAAVEVSISDERTASSKETFDSSSRQCQHWGFHPGDKCSANLVFGIFSPDGRLNVGFDFRNREKHFDMCKGAGVICHPRRQYLRSGCRLVDESGARFSVDYRFLIEAPGAVLFCVTVTNVSSEALADTCKSLDVAAVLLLRRDSGDSAQQLVKSGCGEVKASWMDASSFNSTNTHYTYYEDDTDEILAAEEWTDRDGIAYSRMSIRRCLRLSVGASRTLSYRLCDSRRQPCWYAPDTLHRIMTTAEASSVTELLCTLPAQQSFLALFGTGFPGAVVRCLSGFLLNLPCHSACLTGMSPSAFYLLPLARLDSSLAKQETLSLVEHIIKAKSYTNPAHWCERCDALMPAVVTTLLEIYRLYGSTQTDFVTRAFTAVEQDLLLWFKQTTDAANGVLKGEAARLECSVDSSFMVTDVSFWSWFCAAKALELTSSLGLTDSSDRLSNLLLQSTPAMVHCPTSGTGNCDCYLCVSGGLFPLLECATLRLQVSRTTRDNCQDLNDGSYSPNPVSPRVHPTLSDGCAAVESTMYTDPTESIGLISRRLNCRRFRQACRCLFDPDRFLDKCGIRTTPSTGSGRVSLLVNYLVIEALIAWETVFGDSLLLEYPTCSENVTTLRLIIEDICRRLLSSFKLPDPNPPDIHESVDTGASRNHASPADDWSAAFIANIAAYLKYSSAGDKNAAAQVAAATGAPGQGVSHADDSKSSVSSSNFPGHSQKEMQVVWEHIMQQPLQFVEQLDGCFANQNCCWSSDAKWKQKQD